MLSWQKIRFSVRATYIKRLLLWPKAMPSVHLLSLTLRISHRINCTCHSFANGAIERMLSLTVSISHRINYSCHSFAFDQRRVPIEPYEVLTDNHQVPPWTWPWLTTPSASPPEGMKGESQWRRMSAANSQKGWYGFRLHDLHKQAIYKRKQQLVSCE